MNNIFIFNPKEKINWIKHEGKRILYEDYSNLTAEELMVAVSLAAEYIRKEPLNSTLCLINTTNAKYNADVVEHLKKKSIEDKEYVLKTAVIGLDIMKKITLNTIAIFTRRKFKIFDNELAAKEWLVGDK